MIDLCLQTMTDTMFLYTYILTILKEIKITHPAYEMYTDLLVEIGKVIQNEPEEDAYKLDFTGIFHKFILRKIADILLADSSKAPHMGRIVYEHSSKSIEKRMQLIQLLKV